MDRRKPPNTASLNLRLPSLEAAEQSTRHCPPRVSRLDDDLSLPPSHSFHLPPPPPPPQQNHQSYSQQQQQLPPQLGQMWPSGALQQTRLGKPMLLGPTTTSFRQQQQQQHQFGIDPQYSPVTPATVGNPTSAGLPVTTTAAAANDRFTGADTAFAFPPSKHHMQSVMMMTTTTTNNNNPMDTDEMNYDEGSDRTEQQQQFLLPPQHASTVLNRSELTSDASGSAQMDFTASMSTRSFLTLSNPPPPPPSDGLRQNNTAAAGVVGLRRQFASDTKLSSLMTPTLEFEQQHLASVDPRLASRAYHQHHQQHQNQQHHSSTSSVNDRSSQLYQSPELRMSVLGRHLHCCLSIGLIACLVTSRTFPHFKRHVYRCNTVKPVFTCKKHSKMAMSLSLTPYSLSLSGGAPDVRRLADMSNPGPAQRHVMNEWVRGTPSNPPDTHNPQHRQRHDVFRMATSTTNAAAREDSFNHHQWPNVIDEEYPTPTRAVLKHRPHLHGDSHQQQHQEQPPPHATVSSFQQQQQQYHRSPETAFTNFKSNLHHHQQQQQPGLQRFTAPSGDCSFRHPFELNTERMTEEITERSRHVSAPLLTASNGDDAVFGASGKLPEMGVTISDAVHRSVLPPHGASQMVHDDWTRPLPNNPIDTAQLMSTCMAPSLEFRDVITTSDTVADLLMQR